MCAFVAVITGVDKGTLSGQDLELASVAKMSWVARRETTRIEDIAYCLLGLFDVNMPLLYGEGKRAFLRLEEEILTKSQMTIRSLLGDCREPQHSFNGCKITANNSTFKRTTNSMNPEAKL